MDKITIPDLNGTNYFIWELKMKAALSLKRLAPLILEEKPEDLTRKDEMDWITKNSDAIAYIKLSLADEQALQFAAEDNAKVLWDKIRATYMGEGEDRKIDAGNELKNIRMKNGETVADYIARARGISTKCHSLGLDVSPRELVYHTVRGLNGKFSKVRDILKTQRGKSMDEILQILREEEATLNLPIKTRMDGFNEAFYCKRKNEKQTRLCYICRKSNHLAKDCYYRNKNSPSTSQRNNSSRNGHVFTASHREEKPCDNIWILDSGASCHMAKEPVWFKNISPEVMDIYLADKNSKMMSQGTGNVSAKTTVLEAKREEFVDDALMYTKSLCKELEISFEPPRRIRKKHLFVDGSKDVQLSYEDELRRAIFSSIDRVTAEIREKFQQLQNLAQKYAFLRPEVILSMDEACRLRSNSSRH
ncbi:retrovirus-related Pol polyprotein from transposon TNT 1-94 [Trichonephila clavipes]|nr:retrovirus-related Pol polyprotein from transposon TNT 1-94 [Trichonephila clavipes]